jgi:putative DNA primase/helicase
MHGADPEAPGLRADLADLVKTKKEKTHPSEARIAEIFVERHGDEFRYVAEWGVWMNWDGCRWQEEKTLLVIDKIKSICSEISRDTDKNHEVRSLLKHATLSGAEKIARSDRRIAATVEQWDADPWLLNTPGGVIDLRTGAMRAHAKSDYFTKVAGVTPAASPTPNWDAHLDRFFAGDAEMIKYKYRVWGYCATGDVREDALFFYYGDGDNGKTTTTELLRAIFGDYAQEAPMEMFTAKRHGHDHPTELTILHGARLVTASENEKGSRFSEARVKKLTGGGRIKARKMRKDFFEFDPTHKLLFEGNHRPRLSAVGDAWRRRVNMIPFAVKIAKEEKDRDIDQKLRSEAPGILHKIIEGCREWQREGLKPPPSVVTATDKYLSEQDVLKEWFDEYVTTGKDGAGEFTPILYTSYKLFMELRGEFPSGQTSFADDLESRAKEFEIKREREAFYITTTSEDGKTTTSRRGRGFKGIVAVKMPERPL